jgi:hypothetical protein
MIYQFFNMYLKRLDLLQQYSNVFYSYENLA